MLTLEDRIKAATTRGTHNGSLVSIETEVEIVEDHGIEFLVHITTLQQAKAEAKDVQRSRPFNPFLPPDPDLLIGDVGANHAMVLNKFNVLDHHLLIVTRVFEAQEKLLNRSDFAALGAGMSEIDGLGFYNSGPVSGASQRHKHLQLVPLPLVPGDRPTPVDAVVRANTNAGVPTTIEAFDFNHTLIPLDGSPITPARAPELFDLYNRARDTVGVRDETRPYNLLLTRRWMLMVPRSSEFWRKVSINALGFAGSLLVRNRQELAALREAGPLSILKAVAEEPPTRPPGVRSPKENP